MAFMFILVSISSWEALFLWWRNEKEKTVCVSVSPKLLHSSPTHCRGERLLQTHTLMEQEIQTSSSCPIRAREFLPFDQSNYECVIYVYTIRVNKNLKPESSVLQQRTWLFRGRDFSYLIFFIPSTYF